MKRQGQQQLDLANPVTTVHLVQQVMSSIYAQKAAIVLWELLYLSLVHQEPIQMELGWKSQKIVSIADQDIIVIVWDSLSLRANATRVTTVRRVKMSAIQSLVQLVSTVLKEVLSHSTAQRGDLLKVQHPLTVRCALKAITAYQNLLFQVCLCLFFNALKNFINRHVVAKLD